MKILVTGATGFIGSHICQRLTELGHKVYPLVRNTNKFNQLNLPGQPLIGTIEEDKESLWISHLAEDMDAVIHSVGLTNAIDPQDYIRDNTIACKKLICDLKPLYPNLKFILLSSLAAVGPSDNLLERKEEHIPKPINIYGRSKLEAESVLHKYAPEGWNKLILRPPMVVGPRNQTFLDIFHMINSGLLLNIGPHPKNKLHSYICIYDLVEVIRKLLDDDHVRDETFLIAHEEKTTLSNICQTIYSKMGVKKPININIPTILARPLSGVLRKLEVFRPIQYNFTRDKILELSSRHWTCSAEKSQRILNMQYNWNLEDSIEATLDDYLRKTI